MTEESRIAESRTTETKGTEAKGTRVKEIGITYEAIFARLVKNGIVHNQVELANLLGLGRAAVSYVARIRKTAPPEWQRRFEDAGISWQWVTTGEGPIYNSKTVAVQGQLMVGHEIDEIVDGNIVQKDGFEVPLHRRTLRCMGVTTDSVYYLTITGDSNIPVFNNGDIAFVDNTQTKVGFGQYYAISLHGNTVGARQIVVRKLTSIGDKITIVHDNKQYPDITVDADNVFVVGRVVGCLKIM